MIELQGVSKSFGKKQVLKNIDLEVLRGETLVIIGRSGTGKSVLLKIISGLIKPDSGSIIIDGKPLKSMERADLMELRARMGFVFQAGALFDSMTIAENVGLGLVEAGKTSPDEIKQIVEERLEWVGLGGQGNKLPSELSGGMRKRASLARAIATEPEIVLYDEPTTGLDPITAEGINDLIIALRERLKVTAIAVTHDMNSVFKISDRVALLHEGEIVFDGPAKVAEHTDDPLVRQFIDGEPDAPPPDVTANNHK